MRKPEPFYVSAEFSSDGARLTPWRRHQTTIEEAAETTTAAAWKAQLTELRIMTLIGAGEGEYTETRFREITPEDPWIDTDRASFMCALLQQQTEAAPHAERIRTIGVVQGIVTAAKALYAQYEQEGRRNAQDVLKAQAYWARKLTPGAPTG